MVILILSITSISAQNVHYYKLSRKVENGKSSTDVSGGQYITFIADICYESNKKGMGVGHGNMTRNKEYSTPQYTTYMGSSYWGEDAVFKFNTDKSVLNVVIDKDNYYIYKEATAPAGQETCSLIRKSSTTTGGGGSNVVVTPQPVIVNPYNPTPTPSPTPTPTPTPTPSQQTQHKCSLCNGTGRVINTDGVNFGKTKWCSECGKTVPDYHYHTTCPSCKGKGWW